MALTSRPLRLFLDTGVIVSACCVPDSAARGVLILALQTPSYVAVCSEAIEAEVTRIIARKIHGVSADAAAMMLRTFETWRRNPKAEWHALPTEAEEEAQLGLILPLLKHENDLKPVITAMRAQPDWVLSSNTEHWTPALGDAIGLRITTPWDFLARLRL